MATIHLNVRMAFANPKAIRALRKVIETMEDVAEGFPYREDVQEGVRAAKYFLRNVGLTSDGEET